MATGPEIRFSGSWIIEREIIGEKLLKPFSPLPATHSGKKTVSVAVAGEATTAGAHNVTTLFVYRPPTPTNATLISSLSRALDHFPHFAGWLAVDNVGQPCIVFGNGGGVRVVEALVVNCVLDDIFPIEPSSNIAYLYPSPELHRDVLLHVQINLFVCGGMVLAVSGHPHLSDYGQSMSSFLATWSRIARGVEVINRPSPLTYSNQINRSSQNVDQIENHLVHFTSNFIKRLKAERNVGKSFEAVLAGEIQKMVAVARRSPQHVKGKIVSWLGLEFHKLDFGTGLPVQVVPAFLPDEGSIILLSSCSEKGAVDVAVSLRREDMPQFKEIVKQRETIISSKL